MIRGGRRYAARLAERAGVDPAIAAFALSDPLGAGFACGANRNALLLRHAGRPYLSLDDDMVCEMAAAPEPIGPGWPCRLLVARRLRALVLSRSTRRLSKTGNVWSAITSRCTSACSGRSVGAFLAARAEA